MNTKKNTHDPYDLLIAALCEITGRKEIILKSDITGAFQPEQFRKGNHFIREGDVPNKIAFVAHGLMKYYYIDRDGNEWIKHFTAESDFAASYASFLFQTPSLYYIEALEDTTVLSVAHHVYRDKIDRSKIWSLIARRYTEKIYQEKEKREASFLKEDGTGRYRSFLRDYPHLVDRITLKDTASYLGLTQVSLSRIRKKIIG
jgi:CRP-like cAMP-binding protein